MGDLEENDGIQWQSISGINGNSVPSQALGIIMSCSDTDPSRTFYENGGDSLSAMSTFMLMKQQGSPLRFEDFILTNSQSDVTRASLPLEAGGLTGRLSYRLKALSDVPALDAQNLLGECFTQKGDLDKSFGLTTEEFTPLVRKVWPALLKYSFVVVDQQNVLVGVAGITDLADLSDFSTQGCHVHASRVLDYLDSLTASVEKDVPLEAAPGCILYKFLLGTSVKNTAAENVYIMYMMEEEIHRLAQQHGFNMSFAQNTSPLTQQLSDFFGCQRLLSDVPSRHVNQMGVKPFGHLPETTVVTLDIKRY